MASNEQVANFLAKKHMVTSGLAFKMTSMQLSGEREMLEKELHNYLLKKTK